ncbi:hypothetical protein CLU85_1702 [Acidovorax sp. 69]|uniref:hypothetical protein n=1 Tax=Acidovorax sp. 69 TaxID=2035202 RepID=UPI000C2355B2|nr:hypothetical protein [Acidovorax sp. 69]PJI96945.1 hypothetical protein CLU85_1702 [Acidovorax sp. 69]
MKCFARSCILFVSLIAPLTYAAAPDPALLGCWRAVKIVLYGADGSTAEDNSGRCVLQFKDDQFDSTCTTTGGTATTSYQYQIVRPHFYVAKMTSSTFRTDLIGSTREYEYRMEGDGLVTSTASQAKLPAPAAAAPRVETKATKTPCP